MILVTGATGHLGQATIKALLAKQVPANELAVLVRNEEKAAPFRAQGLTIRFGDYMHPASLENTFDNIDKVLFISSSDIVNDRLAQHKNVIDAAKASGVKQVIYTAFERDNSFASAIPFVTQIHLDTVTYLQASGLAYTIMNNTLYADLIAPFITSSATENGISFPAGLGKVPFVSRNEMANAAAELLVNDALTSGNKSYAIAGEESYSFAEIASIITEITGKNVAYQPDMNTYLDQQTATGLPLNTAQFFAGFGTAIAQNEFDTKQSDLALILGRKPMSLKAYLSEVFGA